MSLLDTLIGCIAPYECLSCGHEGRLVCSECAGYLRAAPEACYRCDALSPENRVCDTCKSCTPLRAVHGYAAYEGLAKSLIWQLKFNGAQAAAQEIAECMQPYADSRTGKTTWIVPVPTAASRARRRGYDQAKLIAREVSRQAGLPYVPCLRRRGRAQQVGAGRRQRITQLASAFTVNARFNLPPPDRIILIDDVMTTGATLEAAAHSLQLAGARHIEAIVFARA